VVCAETTAGASIGGYVFDAYGTLFDVHSVVEVGRELTADPMTLSVTWRQKQLEYTWLRALMGRYEDFWTVTEAALRHAIRRLAIPASEAQIRRLMDAYLSLACFPEVPAVLATLAPRSRAILSNGSPRMLQAAVASSGLGSHLDHVLSVDAVKTYKPAPAVYALAPQALGRPAAELLFVSSNAWDVAGAKAFGYRVAWCNRGQTPEEELGLHADVVINRLDELPDALDADALTPGSPTAIIAGGRARPSP
jgi:2-haloacid dehalogenase